MIRSLLQGTIFTVALLGIYAAVGEHDARVEREARIEAIKAKPLPHRCAERDYVGRKLVATYYAYSDRIQTLRCTYTRRIYS